MIGVRHSSLVTVFDRLLDPLQIVWRAINDGQADDFRRGIGVVPHDGGLYLFKEFPSGLDEEEKLAVVRHFPFPSVDRANGLRDVHASGETGFDQPPGDLPALAQVSCRHQDNDFVRQGFLHTDGFPCALSDPKIQ